MRRASTSFPSGLSDEDICERWVYDSHFPHFTGEEFFAHEFAIPGAILGFGELPSKEATPRSR